MEIKAHAGTFISYNKRYVYFCEHEFDSLLFLLNVKCLSGNYDKQNQYTHIAHKNDL